MQKEFVGQRQFEKLPALPRRPKLTDMQQQAVDAYFELQAVQNVPHMATSASVGTIADAYISRAQAGGGRAKELQQKVDPFKKDPEYQAAITFETEVRKRAKEALQLERQAYEDGLVFLQIGASQGLGGQQSAIQKDIASDLRAWTDRRKALLSEPAVLIGIE